MSNCSCEQSSSNGECCRIYQYAVKVICGTAVAECGQGTAPPVAPGTYYTAINIHNLSECNPANFRWKVTQANPLKPGKISGFSALSLAPDESLELDCSDIIKQLGISGLTFLKGFAVLESDVELDVVAVYTGTQGSSWPLNALHMERVPGRVVRVGDDLIMPLNTGVADWRFIGKSPGPFNLNQPVVNILAFVPPLSGQQWVSEKASDAASSVIEAPKRYQLCFELCCGFSPVDTPIQIAVDDQATLWFNNVQVGPTNFISATAPTLLPGSLLRLGQNCLQIEVVNTFVITTGFALAGLLNIPRGRCCCRPLPILPTRRRDIPDSSSTTADSAPTTVDSAPTASASAPTASPSAPTASAVPTASPSAPTASPSTPTGSTSTPTGSTSP